MCEKCVRKSKRLGIGKKTYGQIKALAQSFYKYHVVGFFGKKTNVAVEAHLHKIEKARTNKNIYDRKKISKDI